MSEMRKLVINIEYFSDHELTICQKETILEYLINKLPIPKIESISAAEYKVVSWP